jgi:hypothetical protein
MPSKKILVQQDYLFVPTGSNPASGAVAFYPKSDNSFYKRNAAGAESKLWDSQNHGHNSGMNADMLDGQHASEFASSNHLHSYLPLAGGTIAGNLTVSGIFYLPGLTQNNDAFQVLVRYPATGIIHYRSDMLSKVAVSQVANGHSLIFDGINWVNNNYIRSDKGENYNSVYLISKDLDDDFGDAEIYMNCEEGINFMTNKGKNNVHSVVFNFVGIYSSKLTGIGERYLVAGADGYIKVATTPIANYWQLTGANILSPISANHHLSINENMFFSGMGFFNGNDGGTVSLQGYIRDKFTELPTYLGASYRVGTLAFNAYNSVGYGHVAAVVATATQDHTDSSRGTQLALWTTANNTNMPLEALIIRHDRKAIGNNGFGVFGFDGQSGTMTLITGCSYNSGTKTLIYTRVTATFNGGIITVIAAASNLNVQLS